MRSTGISNENYLDLLKKTQKVAHMYVHIDIHTSPFNLGLKAILLGTLEVQVQHEHTCCLLRLDFRKLPRPGIFGEGRPHSAADRSRCTADGGLRMPEYLELRMGIWYSIV